MVSAEEMESSFIAQNMAKNMKWAAWTFGSKLLIVQNEHSSSGDNIDADILSRPMDKDSNQTLPNFAVSCVYL